MLRSECLCPQEIRMLKSCHQGNGIGTGTFGRWLGHESGAHMNGVGALVIEAPESNLTPSTM